VSPPASACQLRVDSRRIPLARDAGGDIHDYLVTEFGARLLVGDVMGSGVPAQETGREVVAAWRDLAVSEPSLPGVAVRLHGLIARSQHPERFVTALLVNFGCPAQGCAKGNLEIVCCGHPPPLLLRGDSVWFAPVFPAPPLGLLDLAEGWCVAATVPFGPHDRLLLYTDGVSEARDAGGGYFPLAERAAAALTNRDQLLDALLADLRAHLGDAQADDILLLLAGRGTLRILPH
jgi:serine phosphatase RsbU (regulator of sigma subunit)